VPQKGQFCNYLLNLETKIMLSSFYDQITCFIIKVVHLGLVLMCEQIFLSGCVVLVNSNKAGKNYKY